MVITKRGRIVSSKVDAPWRGICRACSSEAEAALWEMTSIIDMDPFGFALFSWEECPVCGAGGPGRGGGMLFHPESSYS